MRLRRTKICISLFCVLSPACVAPQVFANRDKNDKDKDKARAVAPANDPRRALHALNRLSFGPRPGDLQQVMALGVDQWIELQLHPEKIDDSALNARLEPLRTIRMSTKEIAEDFPDPQEINQVMNGKRALPSDPALRAVYQVQMARLQERKERKESTGKIGVAEPVKMNAGRTNGIATPANVQTAPSADAADNRTADGPTMNGAMNGETNSDAEAVAHPSPPAKLTPEEEEQARRREEALYADLDVQQLPSLLPDQRFKKVLSMSTQAQLAFADTLRGGRNFCKV